MSLGDGGDGGDGEDGEDGEDEEVRSNDSKSFLQFVVTTASRFFSS
ncbi:MAG: hypothetical protein ACRC8Y_03925 [Chroococcales cyanobacterium]